MRADDLPRLMAIAAVLHPTFPEREEVFAERLALFPAGALMLVGDGNTIGYGIAYPGKLGQPAALDTLIGSLPAAPDTLYLHDVAILPPGRGNGAAGGLVSRLSAVATEAGLATLSLVAVYGAGKLWARHGFMPRPDLVSPAKMATYGDGAVYMVAEL